MNPSSGASESVLVAPAAEPAPEDVYDPNRDAVRIDYENRGVAVAVWLVPDGSTVLTIEGEPAVRRSDLVLLLELGVPSLRYTLAVLRAFPGARLRAVGNQELP